MVTLSAELSGSYNSAQLGKRAVEGRNEDGINKSMYLIRVRHR